MPSLPAPATGRALGLLLVLFVSAAVFRLPGLSSPPTDIHHVRQSDTSSIARNFAREGVDLLRPRIDWAGPDAGTVESELPLYAAATAGLWRLAGTLSPVWPRGLAMVFWMLGGVGLLLVVRRRLPGPAWVYLALYMFSPLALAFSRTVQPDALAICLLIWALERADSAGDRGKVGPAVVAGLLLGLSVASKGTTAFLAPLVVLLAVGRGGAGAPARGVAALAPGVLLPAGWYWHAHAHLGVDGATFGVWGDGANKWGGPALWLDADTWRSVLGTLITHTLTPLGVALVGFGLVSARKEPALRPWLLGLGLGGVAMIAVADGFRLHNYYQLILVPFASVLAGAGAVALFSKAQGAGRPVAAALLVVLLALGGLSALQGLTFAKTALTRDSRIEIAALALSHVVPAGRALVVVDRHPQTLLYATDRRGWHRSAVAYGDVLDLEELGAEYLLLTETSPSWSDSGLLAALEDERPLVARSPGWLLFQLQRRRAAPVKEASAKAPVIDASEAPVIDASEAPVPAPSPSGDAGEEREQP
jgi:hypothetical protein